MLFCPSWASHLLTVVFSLASASFESPILQWSSCRTAITIPLLAMKKKQSIARICGGIPYTHDRTIASLSSMPSTTRSQARIVNDYCLCFVTKESDWKWHVRFSAEWTELSKAAGSSRREADWVCVLLRRCLLTVRKGKWFWRQQMQMVIVC